MWTVIISICSSRCFSFEDNLAIIMEEQLTRYPICREDKDHIIGFLHVKDLMKLMVEGKKPNLRKLARKALVVPESMDVNVLLKTMQGSHSQLAIVVDEFGGTAGMVTIEDIVEEIVGDIQDEFDEERPTAEARGNHVYSVDAKMLLEELEDILEIKIEDEDVDSVGGWLYDQIGGNYYLGSFSLQLTKNTADHLHQMLAGYYEATGDENILVLSG